MDYGPPPLFNQGVSARARLAFFSFLAIAMIVIDSRIRVLETVRVGVGVVLYPVQQVLLIPSRAFDAVGDYFATVSTLQRENERLRQAELANAQSLQQARELAVENERLRKLLGARERLPNASMLAAVLYETRDRYSRKIVLHAGSNEGVRPGQPGDRRPRGGRPGDAGVPRHFRSHAADRQGPDDSRADPAQRPARRRVRRRRAGHARPAVHGAERRHRQGRPRGDLRTRRRLPAGPRRWRGWSASSARRRISSPTS